MRRENTLHRARSQSRQRRSQPALRRRGIARLRSEYFSRIGELAIRYEVRFDQVIRHLWRGRRSNPRLLLRHVQHLEDLIIAVACVADSGRAWSDLIDVHERTLIRRCRDCRDELEATVEVRRFVAQMRRDVLTGRSALAGYTGMRPLRTWLGEAFQTSRQRNRRANFVLDPADSMCGAPFTFSPTSGAVS